MKTLTASEVQDILVGIPDGAMLFVSYEAGEPPTPAAVAQAARARRMGLALRHFTGTLVGMRRNRWNQLYFTVFVNERDGGYGGPEGAYRSFNPSVGDLFSLVVIDPRPAVQPAVPG